VLGVSLTTAGLGVPKSATYPFEICETCAVTPSDWIGLAEHAAQLNVTFLETPGRGTIRPNVPRISLSLPDAEFGLGSVAPQP